MDELVEYLERNRALYTREALTRQLIEAGHDPADVEAAWARIDVDEGRPPGTADRRNQAALIVAIAYLGTLAVFFAGYTDAERYPYGGTLAPWVLAVVLFIPGIVGFARARQNERLRHATAGALLPALAVPLAFLVGLSGLCIATYPPYQGAFQPPAVEDQ
jgi:hypothetical protein